MEQCEQSLYDLIEERKSEGRGPYPVEYIVKVAVDIAKALKYLHASLILHGDIKSGNILVKSEWLYAIILNNVIKSLLLFFYFLIYLLHR